MKKIGLSILLLVMICLVGCIGVNDKAEDKFVDMMSKTDSYIVEGIMETNYIDVNKECKFVTKYSGSDKIKVSLTDASGNETQVIIKNSDGVYIVIPSVNKNYKIKSEFPEGGSYPYLLNSLVRDICNAKEKVETEDDNTKTIEIDINLPNDQKVVKEKIIFDKKTDLPKEVLLLDNKGEVYIRTIYTKIDLNTKIDDKEYIVNDTINDARATMTEEDKIERSIKYPRYVPEGSKLSKEYTQRSEDDKEVVCIMTYSGDNTYTIIQEYVIDQETISLSQEYGTIDQLFGVPIVIKTQAVEGYYNGIKYTVASNTLSIEEMKKIIGSYFVDVEEK